MNATKGTQFQSSMKFKENIDTLGEDNDQENFRVKKSLPFQKEIRDSTLLKEYEAQKDIGESTVLIETFGPAKFQDD